MAGQSTAVVLTNNDLTCRPTLCQTAVSNEMAKNLNVNAANNYWGTANAAAIPGLILDHEDDAKLGKVMFVPFLRRPVAVARGGLELGLEPWIQVGSNFGHDGNSLA